MFGGGGNGGGGRRGSRGVLGGSGGGGTRSSGSKFEASFGTLEFFANLGGFDDDDRAVQPQPNLAPAARRASTYDGNDDDKEDGGSDEEAQRAGHQGAQRQKLRTSRHSEGDAAEGDSASEARRKSDGDADLDAGEEGASSRPSSKQLPVARPKHRSASMGFLPTRSTGVLSHDLGGSAEATPPDFSRAASSSSSAPRRGTSYRVSPLQQAASGGSFHSSAGPKLMSDPNSAASAAASAAERPKLTSESESAWSVVEAELEAVGSCHGSGSDLALGSGSHLQAEIKRWAADRHNHDVYDDWGGKAQRRKSRLGLIVAVVSVLASAGAAIVLVQSGNGAFGGGGTDAEGGTDAVAATASIDSVISTLPTESAEDSEGGGGEPRSGHRGPHPPPITTDLFESCSPSNVYSTSDTNGGGGGTRMEMGSGYEACKFLCEGAECCYLPPGHALSCLDYVTEEGEGPCPVYIRTCSVLDAVVEAAAVEDDEEEMAVFEGDNGSVLQQAVKASPLPPDRDVLKARCGLTAVRSASGYSRCWDLCEEALCCVEDEEDDSDVAVFLEARSAAAVSSPNSAPQEDEGTDGGGVDEDEGPCRDDCELFEPCRSLFSMSGAAAVEGEENTTEDVYVVEEEEGEGGDV